MRECKHCGDAIDPNDAIYDGAAWFCNPACHGKYLANLATNPRE